MRKLGMLAATLALLVVMVIPAIAQVEQGFEQEAESGDFEAEFSVENTGDSSNVCTAALQFGNTGNLQNAQGVVQYGSVAEDFEFEGSTMEFAPALETACQQAVEQAAAAASSS